ncbi:MAG: hypothetical protein WC479_10840 [Candidatus Izemoplasmatales bacterium]
MNKRQRINKAKKGMSNNGSPAANKVMDAELSGRLSPSSPTIPGKSPAAMEGYDFQANMGQKGFGQGVTQGQGGKGLDNQQASMYDPKPNVSPSTSPDRNSLTDNPSLSSRPSGDNAQYDDGVYEKSVFYEHGVSGLTRFGGFVYEEWMKELQGRRGALTYREMRDNDAIIGAFLYAIEMLIRQVKWRVEPAGETPADIEAKEFLESCMDDMSMSWNDTISEILSMLPFGFCYMELCYKKRIGPDEPTGDTRSKFSDGRIGWRKWGIRAQETLWRWRFDMDGSILGMEQIAAPDYKLRYIPIEKALLFRTKSNKNNPEGRSLLRNVYRSWYFKKNIEEIEAIGIERDLAGLPVMWLPAEVMEGGMPGATAEQAAAYNAYKKIVTNIKRDEQEGVMLPLVYDDKGNKMYDLELLTSGATRRQFDTNLIIQRYEQRIAMTVMADFLMLGHEKTGSYALSVNKTSLFQTALSTVLQIVADVVNTYAIPRLMKLNTFDGLTDYPKLIHDDIERANLTELGTFIKDVAAAGGITLGDIETENYLREAAKLPKKSDEFVAPSVTVDDNMGLPNAGSNDLFDVDPDILGGADPNDIAKAHKEGVHKIRDVDRELFIAAIRELRDAVKKGSVGDGKG